MSRATCGDACGRLAAQFGTLAGAATSAEAVRVNELTRRVTAEFLGTAFLLAAVIGSGIAAARLSPDDVGLRLLENSVATGAALVALILALQPVSAAFNPVVTLVERALGAVVATLGLVVVIFGVVRSGRGHTVAFAVGGYITAAYWFTSSTSFANPAVTVARMFSDTFAGIAPVSVAMFVLMQLVGGALGLVLVRYLYPLSSPLPNVKERHDHEPDRTVGRR